MKLKTLRGKEARKEANKRAMTRGTIKRREAKMEANGTAMSRDIMLTRRIESPRLNKKFKGWSSPIRTWPIR